MVFVFDSLALVELNGYLNLYVNVCGIKLSLVAV